MIRLAILGSTGSIGLSALEVVRRHPDRFQVVALSAHRRTGALAAQVEEFTPRVAVVVEPNGDEDWPPPPNGSTRWSQGRQALLETAARDDVDVVVNAVVGAAGLEPTLRALEAGKRLALANKESLVAGGSLVRAAAERGGGELVPVDSEHSAILQCLAGSGTDRVARIILTASGGPFRTWNLERIRDVRPEEALNHPTWDMGAKITVDSASLANKALEVIEGHFLFDLPYARIDAVVHPQSIVHSFVEFVDGSLLAQVGQPTMELPILYALTYPDRVEDLSLQTFDPVAASPLTFEAVDRVRFPLFGLGVDAGAAGGTAPAVFNAANEVAVAGFLEAGLGFLEMADVVAHTLDRLPPVEPDSVEHILEIDGEARRVARSAVERLATSHR